MNIDKETMNVHSRPDDDAYVRRLVRIAWLMDRALTIPGTRITVGLDAALGLLPGLGDVLTGLVQAGLVLSAVRRYPVPKEVAAKMAANVLFDVGVGLVPFLGDAFDAAFKANTRNVKLLQPYVPGLEFTRTQPPDPVPFSVSRILVASLGRYLIPIGLAMLLVLVLALIGTFAAVRWLLGF